jgi:nucleotide-binding universal stress UspA family protein
VGPHGAHGRQDALTLDALTLPEPAALDAPAREPVVVGVDGSALSLSAVRLAAREAARHRRALRIVHSFNWEADQAELPAVDLRHPAEHVVERAIAVGAEAAPDVPISGAIIEGPAVTTLLRESGDAALLAIGDGGLAGCTCVPVDATAVQIAARAGCSVLVVRENPQPPGPVLVGVDGSTTCRAALELAFDTAARREAELVVVQAWDPVEPPAGGEAGITARLTATLEPMRREYPTVPVASRVLAGDPKDVLVHESRTAELVVASARGDQPWRGMLGAVSQALLYHSPAPVIIVRGAHELYIQE